MRSIFTLIGLLIFINSNAQILCGTVNEGGSITLTAPVNNVFISIEFASYGTPNGSCGSFTIGGCHASSSQSITEGVFLGLNSATINATNGVFGDPCGGTPKRLYIQALYSSVLPLTLISFTAQKTGPDKVLLAWSSDNEINSSHFVIESSTDGILFEETGKVTASGNGRNNYSFTKIISNNSATLLFRLKMVDRDGEFKYSNIVRINNIMEAIKLSVFPNPATDLITITSNKQQELFIKNINGQGIKKILLINGSQTVNISTWPSGIYFIKNEETTVKFIKK